VTFQNSNHRKKVLLDKSVVLKYTLRFERFNLVAKKDNVNLLRGVKNEESNN